MNDNITGEILYDMKNDGNNEVTWQVHKLITLRLAQAYKRINSPKYKRIIDCAGYIEFRRYADNSLKLHSANFCQIRLCPTCNWRRSKKVFAQISKIMDCISDDYEFIFLTLTVKNVESKNLKSQIDDMVLAYKKLCLRKRFKDSIKGWIKCFELTYNWKTSEYHPHFHVMLAIDKGYFQSAIYISQDEFCELWQSCLKVDYKPIVDVRVFKESEKGKRKEVAEVAKYTIKSSHIMANLQGISEYNQGIQDEVKRQTDKITDEIVLTLDSTLENRRLIEFGGVIKAKRKELKLADVDDNADLVHTEVGGVQKHLSYEIERYRWHIGYKDYVRLEDKEPHNQHTLQKLENERNIKNERK